MKLIVTELIINVNRKGVALIMITLRILVYNVSNIKNGIT